jgi:hypothetical protein
MKTYIHYTLAKGQENMYESHSAELSPAGGGAYREMEQKIEIEVIIFNMVRQTTTITPMNYKSARGRPGRSG